MSAGVKWDSCKVTWWLYWGSKPIASVRAHITATPSQVIEQALSEHGKNPTIYSDFPNVTPWEHEQRLRTARVCR
jgi:hypothetical protein